jgi:hypothetical protein
MSWSRFIDNDDTRPSRCVKRFFSKKLNRDAGSALATGRPAKQNVRPCSFASLDAFLDQGLSAAIFAPESS